VSCFFAIEKRRATGQIMIFSPGAPGGPVKDDKSSRMGGGQSVVNKEMNMNVFFGTTQKTRGNVEAATSGGRF
jgi:hypothetical protein